MNRVTSCITLLMASFVVTGCKIVVEVPEGGMVSGESGEFICAGAQTCEIDVDDASFRETFTAIPAETHEFRGWKHGPWNICGDEQERYAPCLFSTLKYAGISGILSLLEADIPMYLKPEFVPKASAAILFPFDGTSAVDSVMTVRGRANDPDGIATVTVNGLPASITGADGAIQTADQYYTEVTWERRFELQPGTTEFVLSVVNGEGSLIEAADSASVDFLKIPAEFFHDPENGRLIGRGDQNGATWDVVIHDLENGTQTLLTDRLDSFLPACYKSDTEEYLYVYEGPGKRIEIRSLDLETGVTSLIAATTIDPITLGFNWGPYYGNLACAPGEDSVYLAYGLARDVNGSTRMSSSRITKFDLEAGDSSLLAEFDLENGDTLVLGLGGVELLGNKLVAYPPYGNGRRTPLYLVDTTTGETAVIEGSDQLVADLAVDPDTGTIYVVNFDAVYRLDPGATSYRILSSDTSEGSLNITSPVSTVLDKANGRLLVGDLSLNMVIAIDLGTGERTELVSRRQGEGPSMIFARHMYITEDLSTAYVADDGSLSTEKLFKVDLATGNRQVIGRIQGMSGLLARGIEVDEENNTAYLAFADRVLLADLESEEFTEISGPQAGFGPLVGHIFGLVLDKENNRLLIGDSEADTIYSLDLRTRVREVFSQAGVRGRGEPFADISSLAFDAESNQLFVTNRLTSNIMSVDMDSGDRTVILDACIDAFGRDLLGRVGSLKHISYGEGRLFIIDTGLSSLDLDSGECSPLGFQNLRFLETLRHLEGDWYFAATIRGIGLYDMKTNEYVYISE